MPRKQFSNAEARRIALAAQGFGRPRPAGLSNAGHIRRVIEQLGLLQIDFVNVLLPAHQLVPYSRLGAYAPEAFDRAVYGNGNFTEQWAHEASIVPMDCWPLLEYRRRGYEQSRRSPLFLLRQYRQYLEEVLAAVREQGACTAQDVPQVEGPKRKPGDWHRSVPRWALEYHFGNGQLVVARRLKNFQRVYDLPEREVPDDIRRQAVSEDDARRELLARAARAMGIATTRDLADYFRMPGRLAQPRVEELAEAGEIRHVAVDGWRDPAWLHRNARLPRQVEATALLSPFDPVVWFRPRAERLFDFHYRIEIYVPEKKRRWGYYVLPFLVDDRIVARVDLKAERQVGILDVRAAHAEAGIDTGTVAEKLAGELRTLADWLGLSTVHVGRRGDLARPLRDAVRSFA